MGFCFWKNSFQPGNTFIRARHDFRLKTGLRVQLAGVLTRTRCAGRAKFAGEKSFFQKTGYSLRGKESGRRRRRFAKHNHEIVRQPERGQGLLGQPVKRLQRFQPRLLFVSRRPF